MSHFQICLLVSIKRSVHWSVDLSALVQCSSVVHYPSNQNAIFSTSRPQQCHITITTLLMFLETLLIVHLSSPCYISQISHEKNNVCFNTTNSNGQCPFGHSIFLGTLIGVSCHLSRPTCDKNVGDSHPHHEEEKLLNDFSLCKKGKRNKKRGLLFLHFVYSF